MLRLFNEKGIWKFRPWKLLTPTQLTKTFLISLTLAIYESSERHYTLPTIYEIHYEKGQFDVNTSCYCTLFIIHTFLSKIESRNFFDTNKQIIEKHMNRKNRLI